MLTSVKMAQALPFDGGIKGLVLRICLEPHQETRCRSGRTEVIVRLPSPTYVAFINLKESPVQEAKDLDPDAWEWHKVSFPPPKGKLMR